MGAAFKDAEITMERSHEKGIALVSVLGMLATFMLLTAIIVALTDAAVYRFNLHTVGRFCLPQRKRGQSHDLAFDERPGGISGQGIEKGE